MLAALTTFECSPPPKPTPSTSGNRQKEHASEPPSKILLFGTPDLDQLELWLLLRQYPEVTTRIDGAAVIVAKYRAISCSVSRLIQELGAEGAISSANTKEDC